MALPLKMSWDSAQTVWASQLNPLISNPISQGLLLNSIQIANGSNVINHKLGKKLTGWLIVGINGSADIYDTQSSNQTPELTLKLTSNASVTINLWVF